MMSRLHSFTQTLPSLVATGITGVFGVWQGLTIILADDGRFTSPGYAVVHNTAGGVDAWGAVVLVGGLAVLLGMLFRRYYWLKVAGLYLVAVWCVLFGISSFAAVAISPTAGPTGGPTYTCLGLIIMCLVVYRRDAK